MGREWKKWGGRIIINNIFVKRERRRKEKKKKKKKERASIAISLSFFLSLFYINPLL